MPDYDKFEFFSGVAVLITKFCLYLQKVRKKYPFGYTDHMIRIDKGPGDFFYAIVLETEDTSYLIKVDVKVDDQVEEEEDKDFFGDEEIKDDEGIMESDVADDSDE